MTDDSTIIRELIRHGANASNIYKQYGKTLPESCPKKPIEPTVKVFIVGKQGMGKTTLATALGKESSLITYVTKRLHQVSGVEKNTAGVIPHDIHSKTFGRTTVYDFAGHEEFYSSHDVILRSSIASSPAIFLLVANLSLDNEEFRQSILSWLAFLENQGIPEDPKPHIIIVGSHADKVSSTDVENKDSKVTLIVSSLAFASFHFAGFVPIDCRYAESPSMTKLRKRISKSCSILRHKSEISFACHCLFVYLLDQFQDSTAVRVVEVLSKIQESIQAKSESGLVGFIPDNLTRLCKFLEDLHERGNILLLRDIEKLENSWLILDREAILSQVTGTIFAPNTEDFQQYQNFASSTGIVPFSKIVTHFLKFNPDMIVEFLRHFEFCHEVTDTECQQILQSTNIPPTPDDVTAPTERFFFFPHLVEIDKPDQVWEPNADISYHSCWILQCSHPDRFFTHRFLHVLLLRLAFASNLALQEADTTTTSHVSTMQRKRFIWEDAINRRCSIWKNGIHWGDEFAGTEAIVEVVEGRKSVNVMLRCFREHELECTRLRSALIRKILSIKNELCARVCTSESLVYPSDVESYPLRSIAEVKQVSCLNIAKSVTKGNLTVFDQSNQVFLELDTLLHFEPYFHFSKHILQVLFDEESPNCTKAVSDYFLRNVADCIHQKEIFIEKIFKPKSDLHFEHICQTFPNHTRQLIEVLKIWRSSSEGSYRCLRKELDQFSVFAGRNPLVSLGYDLGHCICIIIVVSLLSLQDIASVVPSKSTAATSCSSSESAIDDTIVCIDIAPGETF